jgi:hypothetical protein
LPRPRPVNTGEGVLPPESRLIDPWLIGWEVTQAPPARFLPRPNAGETLTMAVPGPSGFPEPNTYFGTFETEQYPVRFPARLWPGHTYTVEMAAPVAGGFAPSIGGGPTGQVFYYVTVGQMYTAGAVAGQLRD